MDSNDYGYFGSGSGGYAHYTQAVNDTKGMLGTSTTPSRGSGKRARCNSDAVNKSGRRWLIAVFVFDGIVLLLSGMYQGETEQNIMERVILVCEQYLGSYFGTIAWVLLTVVGIWILLGLLCSVLKCRK